MLLIRHEHRNSIGVTPSVFSILYLEYGLGISC